MRFTLVRELVSPDENEDFKYYYRVFKREDESWENLAGFYNKPRALEYIQEYPLAYQEEDIVVEDEQLAASNI